MFLTGVLDKGGNQFQLMLGKTIWILMQRPATAGAPVAADARVRPGEHGPEYVVAWANETWHGQDIVITKVDIDNLLRAKAAIYAGLHGAGQQRRCDRRSRGACLDRRSRLAKYINVEKAVQIGLLPDLPWEQFQFLGNTSVKGALSGPAQPWRARAHHADRRRA